MAGRCCGLAEEGKTLSERSPPSIRRCLRQARHCRPPDEGDDIRTSYCKYDRSDVLVPPNLCVPPFFYAVKINSTAEDAEGRRGRRSIASALSLSHAK